jgi:hypothetical protein
LGWTFAASAGLGGSAPGGGLGVLSDITVGMAKLDSGCGSVKPDFPREFFLVLKPGRRPV